MIKADVYYNDEIDKLLIMTPVYCFQEHTEEVERNYNVRFQNYSPIGYAVDSGSGVLIIMPLIGLKKFEYMGEL